MLSSARMTASVATVLGSPIHSTCYEHAESLIIDWASRHESRYLCLANVHMVMEAYDSPDFRAVLLSSDLNCPDGMPLVWMQRAFGAAGPQRVRGPELMLRVCAAAARAGIPVGLYGGRPEILETLAATLLGRFPGLQLAYRCAPPHRPLSAQEDERIVMEITDSGARILFVGLGCPKQEKWMAAHRGRVPAVMLGVGAAFDMHAKALAQAPRWMQDAGLEWAYRLAREPRRLAGRYLKQNPRFMALALRELARTRLRQRIARP
jgi:N-acetylglucosaminyldiphosphoundecaprenol N-acetyl-beta-D-mannosaminyltransferase